MSELQHKTAKEHAGSLNLDVVWCDCCMVFSYFFMFGKSGAFLEWHILIAHSAVLSPVVLTSVRLLPRCVGRASTVSSSFSWYVADCVESHHSVSTQHTVLDLYRVSAVCPSALKCSPTEPLTGDNALDLTIVKLLRTEKPLIDTPRVPALLAAGATLRRGIQT